MALLVLAACNRQTQAERFFAPTSGQDTPFDPERTMFEGKAVAALAQQLRTGDEHQRASAVIALGHVHHGCEHHCMHSGKMVPDSEQRRQMLAFATAGHIGARARYIVPLLITALGDSSSDVRELAACELGDEFCGEALAACPLLRERLHDAEPRVRLWAARALYWISFEAEAPIRVSVDSLQHDPDPDLRSMAAYNLQCMGPDARMARPDLQQALSDSSDKVRGFAQQALDSMR
jgi:HEAT repeat protein